ncbi:DinI family protein [Escherichia coli O145]|nr:damage-inducible protein DinI [Escherichia coli O145 str. RM9872]QNS44600.1 damage-inducible protein DinI [Escherichia coli]QNS52953.1 DinI family protein [Escherichia coli O145]QNS63113.1 DinI family protein [Escherichia coli O145]QNS68168.1 DinI family protein [Escherichia coli O145]
MFTSFSGSLVSRIPGAVQKGSVPALQQEMLRRVSKRYDDVEVIIKSTSNDGLSVTRTADKDSAKTFVQETLKDTWESADEWFVR